MTLLITCKIIGNLPDLLEGGYIYILLSNQLKI
jgi:hypothetical protein